MLMNSVARQYAQAIFDLAAADNSVEKIKAELELVGKTVATEATLSNLLMHPSVPPKAKKDTLAEIFGQEISPLVRKSLFLLIDKHRMTALEAVIHEFMNIDTEARNIAEAEVTTAMPLSEAQKNSLVAKLSILTCKNIVLKIREDRRLIGGIVVKIGGKVIDGSVQRQVRALQNALLRAEMSEIGVTN